MEMEESASVNPWAPMKVTTVRLGSKADLCPRVLRTSAFRGKADGQNEQNSPLRQSALCQKRTLAFP